MRGRTRWVLLPFVVLVYVGLLAPLVVVIAVSFGPSPAFEFPPSGLTLRWFVAFFDSKPFVASFFRVSLVVGLLAATAATVLGTAAAIGLVRFRFFGREVLETFFLTPLLVPQILLGAALYLFYASIEIHPSLMTLLLAHIVICTPYMIRSVTAGLVGMDPRLEEAATSLGELPSRPFSRSPFRCCGRACYRVRYSPSSSRSPTSTSRSSCRGRSRRACRSTCSRKSSGKATRRSPRPRHCRSSSSAR